MMGSSELALAIGLFAALGSWVGAVVESVGIGRFWPWVYRYGPTVKSQSIPWAGSARFPLVANSDLISISTLSDTSALFRAPMGLVGFKSYGTTNPIKGTVESTDSEMRLYGRLSVMPLVFIGVWFAMWFSANIRQVMAGDKVSMFLIVLGCGGAVAIASFWFLIERRRFVEAIENLVAQLDGSA